MSLCGISKALSNVEAQATNLKNLINSQLENATEGITATIASLEGAVSGQLNTFKSQLQSLIPALPLPDASLQQDFIKIQQALKTNLDKRNPAAFAALIASVQGKYTGIDIDGYLEDMISNISGFDPCKDVPNLEIFDGVQVLKGNPITVPLEDASNLIDAALNKSEESISKAFELSSKADENITKALEKISADGIKKISEL